MYFRSHFGSSLLHLGSRVERGQLAGAGLHTGACPADFSPFTAMGRSKKSKSPTAPLERGRPREKEAKPATPPSQTSSQSSYSGSGSDNGNGSSGQSAADAEATRREAAKAVHPVLCPKTTKWVNPEAATVDIGERIRVKAQLVEQARAARDRGRLERHEKHLDSKLDKFQRQRFSEMISKLFPESETSSPPNGSGSKTVAAKPGH